MAALAKNVAPPIRTIIADSSALFREELRQLISSDDGLDLVGEAQDEESLLMMLRERLPELILFGMPVHRGGKVNVLQEICAAEMPVKVLIFADIIHTEELQEALRRGANGVILKQATTQWLSDGIRCITAGRYWAIQRCVPDLLRALQSLSAPLFTPTPSNQFGLTIRELEIVKYVVAGYSNQDIAQQCAVSPWAVKRHLSNIFSKLDVANRVELAFFAANHRLAE